MIATAKAPTVTPQATAGLTTALLSALILMILFHPDSPELCFVFSVAFAVVSFLVLSFFAIVIYLTFLFYLGFVAVRTRCE